MTRFTELERAALHAIFAETPGLAPELERQLLAATVTNRENSDGGFFTTIAVADDAPPLTGPRVLGYETHARIAGLEHGFGFILHMDHGRLGLLEGFAWGPESTAGLDLNALEYEVYNKPVKRLR